MNPLFSDDKPEPKDDDKSYLLPKQQKRTIQPPSAQTHAYGDAGKVPVSSDAQETGMDPAVELIRRKVNALYAKEPSAKEEIKEAAEEHPRSKHQQFMYELSTSGKSLADIQTAWHNYYVGLPDDEKHQVWQEFYQANERHPSAYTKLINASKSKPEERGSDLIPATGKELAKHAKEEPKKPHVVMVEPTPPVLPHKDGRSRQLIKKQVLDRVSANTRHKAKEHLRSALFGVGFGALVILIFLFGFFNEVIIAPFIQPSRHVSATPIILSGSTVAPTDQNEVIIPKINVEIPIDFSLTTTDENTIENSLENGVVHYASTVKPGQLGNTAFFGHSSNNIFNPGKYKFAFVLLHELEAGDTFYITYNGTLYTYKVFQKEIVNPDQTSVLNALPDKAATATLITCDPPGTSLHRLVVWGEQVSPDPAGNAKADTAQTTTQAAAQLPSNGPTLWSRFMHWLF